MVAAIARVAGVTELETVAGFAESSGAIEILRKLVADCAEGHAVGKPGPRDRVLERLAENPRTNTA